MASTVKENIEESKNKMEVDNVEEDEDEGLMAEVKKMSTDEINARARMLDNEIRIMRADIMRIQHEMQTQKDKIKENTEKIKVNKTLPYLVSNVIEILDVDPEELGIEEDGANVDLDSQRKGKCAVIKTSTRQTYFLPIIGLVEPEELKPGDLVGVNKDSYLVLEKLPAEYDSRVKAMEVDMRPTEQYSDIGGLDKQIQELVEAVVLPMTHRERFENIGIKPPKGVLLYGPPGKFFTQLFKIIIFVVVISHYKFSHELAIGIIHFGRFSFQLDFISHSCIPI